MVTHRSLRVVLYAIAILRRFRGGGGLNKELQPLASATTVRLRNVRADRMTSCHAENILGVVHKNNLVMGEYSRGRP